MKICILSSRILFACVLAFLFGCAEQPVISEPVTSEVVTPSCPAMPAPLSPAVAVIRIPQECPKPKPAKKVVCPALPKESPDKKPDLLTVGRNENIYIEEFKLSIPAKLDTGAKLSSINALDVKIFERDGKKWIRFALINPNTSQKQFVELPYKRTKKIKQLSSETQKRLVVTLTIQMGAIRDHVDVTLSDRTDYEYQFLVGRTFMEGRLLVDVAREFVTGQ